MSRISTIICIIFALFIGGCATTAGKTLVKKRQSILTMKNEVLSNLYKLKPDVKAQISSAPGYAVFSNANIQIFFFGGSGGYGVVKNNKTGKHTYMKMGEVAIGWGLGAKDFRAVFVFHTTYSMNHFIESGLAFGVQVDAAAKASDKGAAVGAQATVDNITIYQLTETGLVIQATVKGTKYWKDDSLN